MTNEEEAALQALIDKAGAVASLRLDRAAALDEIHAALDMARAKLEPTLGPLRVRWEGPNALFVPALTTEAEA